MHFRSCIKRCYCCCPAGSWHGRQPAKFNGQQSSGGSECQHCISVRPRWPTSFVKASQPNYCTRPELDSSNCGQSVGSGGGAFRPAVPL